MRVRCSSCVHALIMDQPSEMGLKIKAKGVHVFKCADKFPERAVDDIFHGNGWSHGGEDEEEGMLDVGKRLGLYRFFEPACGVLAHCLLLGMLYALFGRDFSWCCWSSVERQCELAELWSISTDARTFSRWFMLPAWPYHLHLCLNDFVGHLYT